MGITTSFNSQFYIGANVDVQAAIDAGMFASAEDHFNQIGAAEGRDANEYFDTDYYLNRYTDVSAAINAGAKLTDGVTDMTAFGHYQEFGSKASEARDINANFEASFYATKYGDVEGAVQAGTVESHIEHYITHGYLENRDPSSLVDTSFYTKSNAVIDTNPLLDSLKNSANATIDSAFFNEAGYLAANADVAAAVAAGDFTSGYDHYIRHGGFEKRDTASIVLDTSHYLTVNLDVAAAVEAGEYTVLQHFQDESITNGELRSPLNGCVFKSGVGAFKNLKSAVQFTNVDFVTGGEAIEITEIQLSTTATDLSDKFSQVVFSATTGSTSGVESVITLNYSDHVDATCEADVTSDSGGGTGCIEGTAGNDNITGTAGDDCINGNGGNDTIDGLAGNDTITGGAGQDQIDGRAGNDSIDGGADDDFINAGADNDTIIGGTGDDTLIGDTGADSIDGGIGNDNITTGTGDDTVIGGAGDDTIDGGADADSIDGGDNNDSIEGGAGDDTINGGDGDDHIHGDAGDDVINVGAGNDNPGGFGGADTINLGAGADRVTLGKTTQDGSPLGSIARSAADVVNNFAVGTDTFEIDTTPTALNGLGVQNIATNAINTSGGNTDGVFLMTTQGDIDSFAAVAANIGTITIDAGDHFIVAMHDDTTTETGIFFFDDQNGDGVVDAIEVALLGVADAFLTTTELTTF